MRPRIPWPANVPVLVLMLAGCWGEPDRTGITALEGPLRHEGDGEGPRTGKVDDLTVESVTSSSLTLYWTEVDDGLGQPAWYRVKYSEPPLTDWKAATVGCHRAIRGEQVGAEISCTIEALDPGTVYEVQLMSHRLEDGVWQGAVYSNLAAGETFASGVATSVEDLAIVDATSSTLTLRWTQVNDGRGQPAWYRIRYGSPLGRWKDGTIGCDRSLEGTEIRAEMSCVVEGLRPGTDYELQLYSYYYRDGRWAAARSSNRTTGTTAPAGPLPDFEVISFGNLHTCGLTADGSAYCWGPGSAGRLGDGTYEDRTVPTPVTGAHTFVDISAGGAHTCAVDSSGSAWCWGNNEVGQLGNGIEEGEGGAGEPAPVRVESGWRFLSISAGNDHNCALDAGGQAYCWGGASAGDGTMERRPAPTPVNAAQPFSSLTAGTDFTCGLDAGGAAYCWGRNQSGQIGDGSTVDRPVPTPVKGGLVFGAISAGGFNACGLEPDGDAHCWGNNTWGQLGDGTKTDRSTPTPVSGDHRFASVVAGAIHSCGIDVDGNAYCWGDGDLPPGGRLGDGTFADHLVPHPVSGGYAFAAIYVGLSRTCGLEPDGDPSCWGHGYFGDGGLSDTPSPVPVRAWTASP